jgi:hypothetical protein
MEDDLTLDGDYLSEKELYVTGEVRGHLAKTAKWGKFLAIVGFIGVGFMVIAALSVGSLMTTLGNNFGNAGFPAAFPAGLLTVFYLFFAAIYFFPILYLYKFSTKIQNALRRDDQISFNEGMHNLSRLYQFMGIFMAVVLSLYAAIIVFAIIGGVANSF